MNIILSLNSLSFDGKPSPDNPDGVLGRHPDTPFALAKTQANPRTPTLSTSLERRFGVLAINHHNSIYPFITDSIFFTEKKKNIIIDGIFTKILYSTLNFTMTGLYIHFQLCSKFSTDGLSLHDNKSMRDNAAHKTYIHFNPSNERNKGQIESICEIETHILQLYAQTQLVCNTKTPIYGLKNQLYSGSIRSHTEYLLFGEDLSSKDTLLTKYIKISGVWENDTSYGITYKVFVKTPE